MSRGDDATWRAKLGWEMKSHGETLADAVAMAPPEGPWLDVLFDDGYGGTCGRPFTVWTKARVYFPCEYDGSESVSSVARDPDGKPTEHV